jgi:NAD(P) transhydrogenase subunit beta
MAIGGGDMPVSISFLNSLSGFSTSAAGFMLSNKALVVSGAFVGCSGIILTMVMCVVSVLSLDRNALFWSLFLLTFSRAIAVFCLFLY